MRECLQQQDLKFTLSQICGLDSQMIYDPKYYYYEQAVLILIATRWTSLHIIVTPIFVSDRHHQ